MSKGKDGGGKARGPGKGKAAASRDKRAEARRAQLRLVRNELVATGGPPPLGGAALAARRIALRRPDRIVWRAEKIRKRDLIGYYRAVAPAMLPYLRDRPHTLERYPEPIDGEGPTRGERRQDEPEREEASKELLAVLVPDEPTLVYQLDRDCIELRPWSSRVGHLDHPDYAVFELEANGASFSRVVDTALALGKLLRELGAESFPKTTGADGLQVFVPLGGLYLYAQAKRFAETVAHLVTQRLPLWTTTDTTPAARGGKVTIDFHGNQRGWPTLAPYSVRALPGAPVSAPLAWEEVKRSLEPGTFTLKTMPKRLERAGDLFKPVLGSAVDILGCLDRLA